MTPQEIEAEVLGVLDRCRALGVPASELDDMVALAQAGEPGVALENLCVQLFEYDVVLSAAVHETLARLGKAMGLQDKYWTRLPSE